MDTYLKNREHFPGKGFIRGRDVEQISEKKILLERFEQNEMFFFFCDNTPTVFSWKYSNKCLFNMKKDMI